MMVPEEEGRKRKGNSPISSTDVCCAHINNERCSFLAWNLIFEGDYYVFHISTNFLKEPNQHWIPSLQKKLHLIGSVGAPVISSEGFLAYHKGPEQAARTGSRQQQERTWESQGELISRGPVQLGGDGQRRGRLGRP